MEKHCTALHYDIKLLNTLIILVKNVNYVLILHKQYIYLSNLKKNKL